MPVHAIDKPIGPTSHDLVARARRALGTRRVGHAGTLDPLASGVLLLLSGDATKLSPWLTGSDKAYLAWVAFGADTPTWDAEGPIARRGDPAGLHAEAIEREARVFLAVREQVPPRFSAIKRGGVASYEAARRNLGHEDDGDEAAAMPPRAAGYRSVRLLAFGPRDRLPDRFGPGPAGWEPQPGGRALPLPPALTALPTALFALEVAAGTYVLAFARDLGEALGVPAHLAGLVRTRAGGVPLERTVPPDAVADAPGLTEADALPLPKRTLDQEQARRVRNGQRLPVGTVEGDAGSDAGSNSGSDVGSDVGSDAGPVGLVDAAGRMVAIAELAPSGMRLLRVWPADDAA
ncbi:MAG: hypothetical protein WD336_04960 [Trueperaceae bacterium]